MDSQKPIDNEFFSIENANMSKSAILPNEDFDKGELEDEHGIERPFTNSDLSIQMGNDQDQQSSKITTTSQYLNAHEEIDDDISQQKTIDKQDINIPDLEECPNCGRKFFVGRLHLHLKNCTAENPFKSKRLDIALDQCQGKSKQQTNIKSQTKLPTPKKKKNIQLVTSEDMSTNETDTSVKLPRWKQEHKQILESIKYSREIEKAQKSGLNLKEVQDRAPRNPLEDNYVFCQYCRRKFDPCKPNINIYQDVAERHIPRCKDIFNRPQPPKGKSLDQNNKKITVKALEKYSQFVRASINEEVEEVDIETIQQHSKTVKTLIHKSQTYRDGVNCKFVSLRIENRMSQSQQQSSNGSSVFLPKIMQSPQSYVPMMSRSTPMVQCPKCKRSFDERASQRHIPMCQQQNMVVKSDDKNSPTRLSPLKQQISETETLPLNGTKVSLDSLLKGDKQFCTNCGAKFGYIHKYCGVCGKKRS